MGAINKNSVRQRIIRLNVSETAVFPIERFNYIESVAHKIGKQFDRKYSRITTEKLIKVTRLQ